MSSNGVAIDDADSPSLVGFTVASYLPVGVEHI